MAGKRIQRPEVRVTPMPPSTDGSSFAMSSDGATSSPSLNSEADTTTNVTQINQVLEAVITGNSVLSRCYNWFYSSNDTIGKKRQVAKIMLLLMLPIAALAGVTIKNLAESSKESQIKGSIRSAMLFAMETGSLIDNLQKERDRVALFVTSQSSETRILIEEIFRQTDITLASLRSWRHRSDLDADKEDEQDHRISFRTKKEFQDVLDARRRLVSTRPDERSSLEEVRFYTNDVIKVLVDWVTDTVQESRDGTLWKTMMAYLLMVMSKENTGVERTLGGLFYVQGGFKEASEYQWYLQTHFQGKAQLKDAKEYSELLKELTNRTLDDLGPIVASIASMRDDILHRREMMSAASLELSALWLNNMSMLMEGQQDIQIELGKHALASLAGDRLADYNSLMLNVGFFLIAFISSPIVVFIVHAMMDDISKYAAILMGQACSMAKDRERADKLLYGLLPKSVVDQLRRRQKIAAESYSEASIMDFRVANFATIASSSQPMQVIDILNSLYDTFDQQIDKFDCHKLQISGERLVLVSGVPVRNGKRHAMELAVLALHLRLCCSSVVLEHFGGFAVQLKIAVCTGPVMGAVVGTTVPRYCLFGATVTAAQLLETECDPGVILVSEQTRNCLSFDSSFQIEFRRMLSISDTEQIRVYELKSKRGLEDTPLVAE